MTVGGGGTEPQENDELLIGVRDGMGGPGGGKVSPVPEVVAPFQEKEEFSSRPRSNPKSVGVLGSVTCPIIPALRSGTALPQENDVY